MATCVETYGEGWVGDYPNCTYSPGLPGPTEGQSPAGSFFEDEPFTGTIGSLGYGTELEGSTWEDNWQKFFDPYDPEEEEMLTRAAGIDVGQLGEAWDLKAKGLGKTWGLKKGELGAGAGASFGKVKRASSSARRKFGGAYSGTITGAETEGGEDIMASYRRSFGMGKSAYDQAMEAGELGLQQATTDIYQGLQTGVFGARRDWEEDQRTTLNILLGQGIWPDDNTPSPDDSPPPGGGGVFNPYNPSDEIEDIVDITTGNPPEETCPTGCVQGYSGCVSITTGQPC